MGWLSVNRVSSYDSNSGRLRPGGPLFYLDRIYILNGNRHRHSLSGNSPPAMSAFISRLLVAFYILFLPLFYGLYVAAMFSADRKHGALWFEGGATQFGPAAFFVLLGLMVIPLMLAFAKYLFAAESSDLGKVLFVCLLLSIYPIVGAIQAHSRDQKFPIQVFYFSPEGSFIDGLGFLFVLFFLFFLPILCIYFLVKELDSEASLKEAHREYCADLGTRFGLKYSEITQLFFGLVERGVNPKKYLPRHLELFSKAKLSVGAYLSFVERAVGKGNMHNDNAFVEIDRHLLASASAGGIDHHLAWLEAMKANSLRDLSYGLCFRDSSSYSAKEISLSEALVEFRIGEFSSPDEYLKFAKDKPVYVSYQDRQTYEKELEMMGHPVLVKMFELGGAHRARALQIVRRSRSSVDLELAKSTAPEATISVAPNPPQVSRPDMVMISRDGQIIMRGVSIQDLSKMVMQGEVLSTDHYWCQGMTSWSLVSAYGGDDAKRETPQEAIDWGAVSRDFFLSWILYIAGGVFIAGLLGYGNAGISGVGSAIGGYLGFIIFVRPVTFMFRTFFRLVIGRRGMDLFK